MSKAFYNCLSLNSLPDISIWNISNTKHMDDIFDEKISSTNIFDLSNSSDKEIKYFNSDNLSDDDKSNLYESINFNDSNNFQFFSGENERLYDNFYG